MQNRPAESVFASNALALITAYCICYLQVGKYNREFCFWTHLGNWVKLLSLVLLLAGTRTQQPLGTHIWTAFERVLAFTLVDSGMSQMYEACLLLFVLTGWIFFFPPTSSDFFSPSLDWHTVLKLGLCVKREVIEKCRQQIFSATFWRLCPFAIQANVARQRMSHFASVLMCRENHRS